METGSTSRQATPIYNIFVEQAKALSPHYLSMIMPSRWFAGGMGLDQFRNSMMKDNHISKIVDYVNAKDCFPQISISGGVCYFLRDAQYTGNCNFISVFQNQKTIEHRALDEFNVLVRYNQAVSIIHAISSKNEKSLEYLISSISPFGLPTKARGTTERKNISDLVLYSSAGKSYISADKVLKGNEYIKQYKVLVSQTSAEHAGEPGKDGTFRILTSSMRVLEPGEICTHSYLLAGMFATRNEAENLLCYLKTKFVRFLILQSLSSIHLTKSTFYFVPMQDFFKPWTDAELYEKYGLTDEEITFIESMIKPME